MMLSGKHTIIKTAILEVSCRTNLRVRNYSANFFCDPVVVESISLLQGSILTDKREQYDYKAAEKNLDG